MIKKFFMVFTLLFIMLYAKNVNAVSTTEDIPQYSAKISYVPVKEFKQDDVKEDYYSQKYMIFQTNLEIVKYKIEKISNFPEGSFVANAKTGEPQEEFTKETEFKIMVPKDKAKSDFMGEIQVYLDFKAINIYYSEEGEILTHLTSNSNRQTIKFDNRNSSLTLAVHDAETYKLLGGTKVNITDALGNKINNIEIESNQLFIEKISEGTAHIEILEVSKDYVMDKREYEIDIKYNEDAYLQIKLKHKKGNLHIEDNAKNATFQIYDSNINFIGTYNTDENGILDKKDLNTGRYLLIQKDVEEPYIRCENQYFNIEEDATCNINIINDKKEIVEPEMPPKVDIEEKQDENQKQEEQGDKGEKDDPKEEVGKEEQEPKEEEKEQGAPNQEEQEKKPQEPEENGGEKDEGNDVEKDKPKEEGGEEGQEQGPKEEEKEQENEIPKQEDKDGKDEPKEEEQEQEKKPQKTEESESKQENSKDNVVEKEDEPKDEEKTGPEKEEPNDEAEKNQDENDKTDETGKEDQEENQKDEEKDSINEIQQQQKEDNPEDKNQEQPQDEYVGVLPYTGEDNLIIKLLFIALVISIILTIITYSKEKTDRKRHSLFPTKEFKE